MLIRLFILARLLSPDDFGLLAVSLVAVELMAGATDIGMVPALVQRPQVNAIHYRTAWTVGVLRALTIAVIVFVAAPYIARIYEEPRAAVIIQVLAIRPLLEALASARVAELVRNLRFRSLALLRLPEAITNTVVAISLAPTLGVWALVAGSMAGPAAVLIISYFLAPWRPAFSLDREATRSLIQFGRWIFLTSLIGLAGTAALSLVITRQLGTAALGLYFLGARLAFLPAEISGQVIADVTFPLYARLQTNPQKLRQAFQSVLVGMFAALLPASILLIALAPSLVEHVLGPKWSGTVPIIRVLALVSIIGFLGDAIFPILKGIGQPRQVMMVEGVQTLLLITCVWFFSRYWGLTGAALASLPAIIVTQLIFYKYMCNIVAHPFAGILKPLVVIAAISVTGAVAAAAINQILSDLIGLSLAVVLSLGATGLLLWILARRFGHGIMDDLAQAFPQFAGLLKATYPRPGPGY